MQVAGGIAEVATGISWDSLFKLKIATPLGLKHTDYIGLGPTKNFRIAGDAGTTMPDYARFLSMILNYGNFNGKQVLSPESMKLMGMDETEGVATVNRVSKPYTIIASFFRNKRVILRTMYILSIKKPWYF